MAAITLDIAGNTRQLDRDIQKTVNRVYSINLKTKGDQPLGRITGKVNEFNKSLDASNARVIAFGASAGIIFGVERAFTALVSSTIEVQKSLQDINVILNVSTQNLQKFGGELFNIARNTGQSFQEVAKAATEFSRQGLGVEETLKRTNEALILSRLSGLDAAKSVESLTAAVNSFASQAVTATEVVNKFATVDAAFAVSSADLADAIARVGSSAAQSGVSLNELIAIVTAAQQTTARGGAVIGNSFKTIFTRLQREKVVDLLGSLGISGTDASGQVKSTIQLLQDLGKVYDTLGSQQQAYVAEQVGGVFQINILKAALADLGKEYSIYSSALNVAAGATDQAIRRNEELNKTYSAQINALQENARQLAAAGGERLLGPSIDRLVGGTNTLLKGFSESDGQGVGAVLGKGILDGLGQFIAGPGLALIGGVLLKLFRDLAKFATGSVQQLLGLNTAATQQRDLQQSINSILAKNPQLLELALKGEQGLNQAANSLLASLQKQTVELQKQAQVAQQISKAFIAQAGVRVAGGVPVVPTPKPGRVGKAAGYIPNFASDKIIEKYTAISLGATSSVRPHMSQGTIGGKKFVMNNQEVEFPSVGKNGDSMVLPTYGDGLRIAAAGFIPNFANEDLKKFRGNKPGAFVLPKEYEGKGKKVTQERNKLINFQQKYGYLLPPGFGRGTLSGSPKAGIPPGIPFASPNPKQIKSEAKSEAEDDIQSIENLLLDNVSKAVSIYTNTLQPLGKTVDPKRIKAQFGSNIIAGAKGALSSVIGAGFEIGITEALGYEAAIREKGGDFDVRGGVKLGDVQKLFGLNNPLMDFKVSLSRRNTDSFYKKITNEEALGAAGQEFGPKEQQINARALAEKQTKEKYREYFQQAGYQPKINLDPKKAKEIEAYRQFREAENLKRFVNLGPMRRGAPRSRAAGFIPNFAAPLVRAVDDKELRMMLSKFGKGWAFQNRSFDQSAMEFFGGSGTYMWDALSRPGEQMSDRQAYKQNIGRAKNWASARKQSSWLVRYNRSKLKDSELLPDMETGGASVYGLPLSKDQIVWPIKQANGPGRIFEKDIPAFLSGQVNDAIKREREAGIPKNKIYLAQEKALTSANPMGLGVFNKLQEPTKRSRKDAMRRKGFARGYIPNFAIEDPDTQAASFGTAIGAITAQLTGLAFAFAFTGNQFKDSLKELTAANKLAGKVTNQKAKAEQDAVNKIYGPLTREQTKIKGSDAPFAPGRAAKAGAFLGSNALGLSIAAPILGETIKNIAGQETATRRGIGETGSAIGQIGSFAATGGLIGGKPGAIIGGALGALLSIPAAIDAFTSEMPDLTAAAKKASQDLTKFSDTSQRLLTASSSLSELRKENASPEKLNKVQNDFIKALSELTPAERARVEQSIKLGNLEEELAKITQERIDTEKQKAQAVALGGLAERTTIEKILSGGGLSEESTTKGEQETETIRSVFKDFFAGKTQKDTLDSLNKAATSGIAPLEDLIKQVKENVRGGEASFGEQLKEAIPFFGNRQLNIRGNAVDNRFGLTTDYGKNLQDILENIIPKADSKQIQRLVNTAAIDFNSFIILTTNLLNTLQREPKAIEESFRIDEEKARADKELADAQKQAQAAITATSSEIQKNIAIQNLWRSAIENINESIRSFSEDLQITQTLTQPREILEGLIGADKDPTRRLAAQEGLARIDQGTRSELSGAGLEFKQTFRDILQKPFQENIDNIIKKLGEQGGALSGEPEDIIKQSNQFQSEAKAEAQKLLQTTENMESYMAQFVSGQISTQKLLEQSRTELAGVGIDVSRGSQASDAIEKAVAELEVKTIQEQVKAFQQRAKLASETKQAILQSRIEQALGTFGGFEGFMNRSEEEQNYIQRITPDLEKIQNIRESTAFRYNNKDSIKEQEKQAPDLGRAFAKVYKELITQSGGAFRDFLQQTIDQGLQQTGATSRSGLAGAGLAGGFDDIVRGRQQDIEQQLKLAEDQLEVTTDPALKRDLQGFIDSIRNIPGGTKGIAQLQTQKELGVARQSDFEKLYGKYENEALNRLKDISPELAASLENAISLSDDPLVAEAQLQSAIQTDMLGYLGPIQDAILQIANLGEGSVIDTGIASTQIEGYKPKLTEAQQKRADEIKKEQEETAKKEAEIKAKKAQEAAIPKDNRTIAEIEAETIAKRDKARAMGTTLEELNRPVDPNSPLEIEKRTIAARDQRRFEAWSMAGGIGLGPQLGNMDLNTEGWLPGSYDGMKLVSRNEMVDPTFVETKFARSRDEALPKFRYVQSQAEAIFDSINSDRESFKMPFDIRALDQYTSSNPLSDVTYKNAMNRTIAEFGSQPSQNINQQPAAAIQQSFTQQEAAFNNNTSAITTLAGGIENLNSTLANFESNFANLNNVPTQQTTAGTQQAGAQPNVTTTTNAPVTVNVTTEGGGGDIAAAVGEAVQNAIPTIIDKVKLALGQKVPPTSNPKFGGGQRADGGFLL